MKTLIAALTALLAGCVYTPERLMEAGTKYERASKQHPPAVAACFVRNVSTTGWRPTPPRLLNDRGGLYVNVQMFGRAHFEPIESGTRVTLWVRPDAWSGFKAIDDFLHGC